MLSKNYIDGKRIPTRDLQQELLNFLERTEEEVHAVVKLRGLMRKLLDKIFGKKVEKDELFGTLRVVNQEIFLEDGEELIPLFDSKTGKRLFAKMHRPLISFMLAEMEKNEKGRREEEGLES